MRTRSCTASFLSTVILTTALGLTAASCGGDGGGGGPATPNASSCDYRPTGIAGTLYCQEYVADATTITAYKGACGQTSGAVWASVGCPRSNSIGGCTSTSNGLTLTNWFYAGGAYPSAASLMASCSQDGKSSYIAP